SEASYFEESFLLSEAQIDKAIQNNPDISDDLDLFFRGVHPKYLPFVIKVLKSPAPEDNIGAGLLKKFVDDFDNLSKKNIIKNKDITSYKNFAEIEAAIVEAESRDSIIKKTKEFLNKAKKGANKIYEDSTYLIVEPTTSAASCLYGKGSKWCISGEQ